MMESKKYLLVEPDFPLPTKSKNHKDFLPIGLLKIAAVLEDKGNRFKLVRGNKPITSFITPIYSSITPIMNHKTCSNIIQMNYSFDLISNQEYWLFEPDEVWITSLFTYWINDVKKSVEHYKTLFPNTKTVVGGIAASLFGVEETKKLTKCDEVHKGTYPEAESVKGKRMEKIYDKYISDVDFQILHAQRGCFRSCPFCGTWRIEPKETSKPSIKEEIFKRKIVFYDNNFFKNKNVHNILDELIRLKKKREILWCESQSGFDGRILMSDPELANKLKKASFRNVRIAWDWGYEKKDEIKKQLDILVNAGYNSKDLELFMLYNWDIPFDEMEKKRAKCFEWQVQISDCRFRPLDQKFDKYNPRNYEQTNDDYFIHEKWSDILIKQFRRNVRRHNICVRMGFDYYAREFERKSLGLNTTKNYFKLKNKEEKKNFLEKHNILYWDPSKSLTENEICDFISLKKKPKLMF